MNTWFAAFDSRFLVIIAFSSCLYLNAGCTEYALNQKNSPLKIGVVGAFSGPFSYQGTELWNGVRVASDRVNREGGVLGQSLELVQFDDQCDRQQGQKIATQIVDDNLVDIVVGHTCSSPTAVAAEIYKKGRKLMLMTAPTGPRESLSPGKVANIRIAEDARLMVGKLENHVRSLDAEDVILLDDGDVFAKQISLAIYSGLWKTGKSPEIASLAAFGDQSQIKNLIEKITSPSKKTVVYTGGYHELAGLLPKLRYWLEHEAAAYLANDPPFRFVISETALNQGLVDHPDAAVVLNNSYFYTSYLNTSLSSTEVAAQFRALGMSAIEVLVNGMKATISTDGELLTKYLSRHPLVTDIGKLSWQENGIVRGGGDPGVLRLNQGKLVKL